MAKRLEWRTAEDNERAGWKALREFLVDRAVERDVPSVLFRLAVEHLSSNEVRIIRPGVVSLMEEIATAREEADKEVYRRVEPLLTWTSCSPTLMFDTRAVHREDPRRRTSKGEGQSMADETFDITVEGATALGTELTQAFNPRRAQPGAQAAPEPDDTWELEGGTAWVWRVPGSEGLTNPVIIADGFSGGASKLEEWAGLWAQSDIEDVYPWGTKLHEKERDVIVLGYDSRCAPIRDNAEVAIECIQRATAERTGDKLLVVGGLSMGGLVTRYALAKLEKQDPEHEVGTYFSYDSPHQGAWIPISLQVFAHFLAGLADLLEVPPAENEEKKKQLKALSDLINSTAARELLWKHTATHKNLDAQFDPDPARGEFLSALAALESTPSTLKKLGVANGRGDGEPLLGVTPGAPNLVWPRKLIPDTLIYGPGATLYAHKDGNGQLVAKLQKAVAGEITVKTTGIPALDGAPGGTLDSFGLAGQALKDAGYQATVAFPDVCFVPVASAVDLAEPSDPFKPIDEIVGESFLHEYKVASQNERHTFLTQELCDWLTEQF